MQTNRKNDRVPIIGQEEACGEASCSHEQICSQLWVLKLQNMPLTLDFDQLLDNTHLGRSKVYEKMQEKHANFDPSFPQGVPLYDGECSPRFWWSHEVIAWLMLRDQRSR